MNFNQAWIGILFFTFTSTAGAAEFSPPFQTGAGLNSFSAKDALNKSPAYLSYANYAYRCDDIGSEEAWIYFCNRRNWMQAAPRLAGRSSALANPVQVILVGGTLLAIGKVFTNPDQAARWFEGIGLIFASASGLVASATYGTAAQGGKHVESFFKDVAASDSKLKASVLSYDIVRTILENAYGDAPRGRLASYAHLVQKHLVRFGRKYPLILEGALIRYLQFKQNPSQPTPLWVAAMETHLKARPRFWRKHLRNVAQIFHDEPTDVSHLLATSLELDTNLYFQFSLGPTALAARTAFTARATCQAALQWTREWITARPTPQKR